MHKKWNRIINEQKSLMRKVKNTKGIGEYFADPPEPGYMKDNISKLHKEIKSVPTSTLRRWEKLLHKYYNLCQTGEERKIINDKLNEVVGELNKRPDAIIEKTED